jgi:DNA-binding response OmpR family regulator
MHNVFGFVVLDVMLPVIDGFEVLRQISKRSTIPVIKLTARTSQRDRIDALNDYLPKPFAPDELLARIRAVLRRTDKSDLSEDTIIGSGGVGLKSRSRQVRPAKNLST